MKKRHNPSCPKCGSRTITKLIDKRNYGGYTIYECIKKGCRYQIDVDLSSIRKVE
jgi:ssDNA-binding Zn-finger/Zn-ribbon topoisomerase 1